MEGRKYCDVIYERFIHSASRFVISVAVDLLEERVQGGISFRFFVLLFFFDVRHKLVPVASVVARRWVALRRRVIFYDAI